MQANEGPRPLARTVVDPGEARLGQCPPPARSAARLASDGMVLGMSGSGNPGASLAAAVPKGNPPGGFVAPLTFA
jgi:hypothetical protein